jgi:hypothetical protein
MLYSVRDKKREVVRERKKVTTYLDAHIKKPYMGV